MINVELKRCITDAAVELACGNGDLNGRLLSAVRALRIVLIREEIWPPILRHRAQEISDDLNRGGTPEETIAALDMQSSRRLAERILHLYADCQDRSLADR
jgi:hypothetical protein